MDGKSNRSSFSASSENLSLNNYQGNNPTTLNRNLLNHNNSSSSKNTSSSSHNNPAARNSSFKSNSSVNTTSGVPNLAPNSVLNTPRASPRKSHQHNHNKHLKRQQPRRHPGDPSSATISLNGDHDIDRNSDNSDNDYNNQFQNSDDEQNEYNNNEYENEQDGQSMSYHGNHIDEHGNKANRQRNITNEENERNAALIAQQNEAQKELEMHKKRLQIYVFVCRCIAYPFIAKQPTDMVRRQLKITKQQLQQIKDNFDSFLQNKMTNIEADEAFTNAVRSYHEVFLKSDRVTKMVASGGCSTSDFRDVFKNNIEKRVRSLPEIDGLSKETVLTSWMTKFDSIFKFNEESISNSIASRRHSRNHLYQNNNMSSECILSKEQLYELFQNILGVKKFEHQLIFNAAQVKLI